MAKYEAGIPTFIQGVGLFLPGQTFETDEVPGRTWIPLDDKAEAAMASRFSQGKPGDPVMSLPVKIDAKDAIVKEPVKEPAKEPAKSPLDNIGGTK